MRSETGAFRACGVLYRHAHTVHQDRETHAHTTVESYTPPEHDAPGTHHVDTTWLHTAHCLYLCILYRLTLHGYKHTHRDNRAHHALTCLYRHCRHTHKGTHHVRIMRQTFTYVCNKWKSKSWRRLNIENAGAHYVNNGKCNNSGALSLHVLPCLARICVHI